MAYNNYGTTTTTTDREKLDAIVGLAERNRAVLPQGTLDQVYAIVGRRPAQGVTITLRASGELGQVGQAGGRIEAALADLARQAGIEIERNSVNVRVG